MEVIMEKITAEQAISLLKNSPIENAMHIDSIRYFIEDEENAEYFCSDPKDLLSVLEAMM